MGADVEMRDDADAAPAIADADADEVALDTSRDDDVDLAQKIFDLELAEGARDETAAVMAIVERRNMAATYATLCERFAWTADAALTRKMADANAKRLGEIEAKIEDAKENLGDVEIRDAMCERAEFYASVGEMEKSERAYEETEAKTASIGQKMDCAFALMRARFSRLELHEVKKLIEKIKDMLDQPGGGDWERKNRLKVYEGLHAGGDEEF